MARTDGDTWDLASSVGATATAVAAARALASRGPNALIDDPFAEPLVKAVGTDVFTKMLSGEIDLDAPDSSLNRQRMAERITVRTRYFDDFFTAATDAGIRQAVILASGLDARAYRLPWPSGTTVYEVDQPQVIEFKTTTLAGLGARPNADLRVVGIDLRNDWPAALRAKGFDVALPTAWIAEGLLVYLPPNAQDQLFDNIASLSAAGSRLATEYVPNTDIFTGEWAQARSKRWRSLGVNVDMSELIYQGKRSHLIGYLQAGGWHVTADNVPDLYTANGFTLPDDDGGQALADVKLINATLK
ncbi:MAG TPA: class I SAM-dependent methyltransferase [Mycobacterium sp.]|jgi:methyltransferase (TIGR00027 family)|nr:class I SAM-dependent methyltransferase [Mycobacterium sp.]